MTNRTILADGHRATAIRRLLDQNNVDPAHRIVVTVCCDRAVLDGEADTFADKDAALSATLRLGQVTAVADRVRVRPRKGGALLSAPRPAATVPAPRAAATVPAPRAAATVPAPRAAATVPAPSPAATVRATSN